MKATKGKNCVSYVVVAFASDSRHGSVSASRERKPKDGRSGWSGQSIGGELRVDRAEVLLALLEEALLARRQSLQSALSRAKTARGA